MSLGLYKQYKRLRRVLCSARVRRQAKSCGTNLKVHHWSSVSAQTELGNNINFNGLVISGAGRVSIGDNFHSGPECSFITHVHDYDTGNRIPYGTVDIQKTIVIEANVWIGSRVIILGGVTIGEGAIIQAGSCVVNDIPKYAIAGGHPAKVFSQRDIEHYERLKAERKFI